jgi:hypothetical protein
MNTRIFCSLSLPSPARLCLCLVSCSGSLLLPCSVALCSGRYVCWLFENCFVLDYNDARSWIWRECHGDRSGFICRGLQLTYIQLSCCHRSKHAWYYSLLMSISIWLAIRLMKSLNIIVALISISCSQLCKKFHTSS